METKNHPTRRTNRTGTQPRGFVSRIRPEDQELLTVLSRLLRLSNGDVIHVALKEYASHHRDELEELMRLEHIALMQLTEKE